MTEEGLQNILHGIEAGEITHEYLWERGIVFLLGDRGCDTVEVFARGAWTTFPQKVDMTPAKQLLARDIWRALYDSN